MNIKSFITTNKKVLLIAVAAILIFLLFIIFRGCNPAPDHSADKKYVDSVLSENKRLSKIALTKVHLNEQLDSIYTKRFDSLAVANKSIALRAVQAQNQANNYALKYQQAIQNKDTAFALAECDTLSATVIKQSQTIDVFEAMTDSLLSTHNALIEMKNNEIGIWKGLYQSSDSAVNTIGAKYGTLYKDYTKVTKKNKFNKTLTRVLGVAVIVLGGTLYLTNK